MRKVQMILLVLLETGLLLVFLLAVGECLQLHPGHLLLPLVLVHLGPGQAPCQLAYLWTPSLRRYMGWPSLHRYMGAVQLASSLLRASGQEHGEGGTIGMLDG